MKIKRFKLKGNQRYGFVRDGYIKYIEPGEIVVRGSDERYYFNGPIDISKEDLEKYFERDLSEDEKSELHRLRKDIITAATQGILSNSAITEQIKEEVMYMTHACCFHDIAKTITDRVLCIADMVCEKN